MNQSGRAGGEAKKRKSPAKSGRVGITDILLRGRIKKLSHQLYGNIMESFWPLVVWKNLVCDLHGHVFIHNDELNNYSYYPPVLHPVLKPHPQLCPWRSRSHWISPLFMLPLSLCETQVQFFHRVLIDDLTKWLWKQVIVGDYKADDIQHYYMATIMRTLIGC